MTKVAVTTMCQRVLMNGQYVYHASARDADNLLSGQMYLVVWEDTGQGEPEWEKYSVIKLPSYDTADAVVVNLDLVKQLYRPDGIIRTDLL